MTGDPVLTVLAPDGAPEIEAGTDLAELLVSLVAVRDGDVVTVTSKAVAKAEGRLEAGDRAQVIAAETVRVVARREELVIARTRHGLTLAAAGVDASNVPAGQVLPLPLDPDGSARSLRRRLRRLTGVNVAVMVSDTAGRAWRHGQTDIAIGAAGLRVLDPYAGRVDTHGKPLTVTAPAVADELAGAAELVQGKLAGRPFAVLRGRADLVLPADEDGEGAAALVRPDREDLFGFGAREAVVRALAGSEVDRVGFGAAASRADVLDAVRLVAGAEALVEEAGGESDGSVLVAGDPTRLRVLAFALGWEVEAGSATGQRADLARLRPPTP